MSDTPLRDIFLQEAEDNLRLLETLIIGIEENPDDGDRVNDAFRAIHSIKGGAGLAGFGRIKDFSHKLEDLFELIRSGSLRAEKQLISVILEGMDLLKLMVARIRDDGDEGEVETGDSLEKISAYLGGEGAAGGSSPAAAPSSRASSFRNLYYLNLEFGREIFSTGIDPLMFQDDLEKGGRILYRSLDASALPGPEEFDPERFYLSWELFYETGMNPRELNDLFCFVMDEGSITIALLNEEGNDRSGEFRIDGRDISSFSVACPEKRQETGGDRRQGDRRRGDRRKGSRRGDDGRAGSYIRVPTDKLERIFNTVSELLISQARLNMLTEENEETIHEDFLPVADALKNLSGMLQDQITSLRMVSLGSTFDSFRRIVRDMAAERGKNVQMQISGRETELDKNMIEKLNDPLKHLIRNCVDHGIESEAERVAAGKSPEGFIRLDASLEGGKVVIEISDDGRGINREKLYRKALEMGLISAEKKLSDGEILNLIFHPGLSTADKLTDLSGRGVGMDVVKKNIDDLHGHIEIISREGDGTTFRLNLPLTLAILDGMLVRIGAEKYILPTLSILEIFRPRTDELKTIYGGDRVVRFREDFIPVIPLHEIFDVPGARQDPAEAELIVVSSGGIKAAVLVDSVMEQYQVVLKSLQRNFRRVDNISSATILGDGTVALIVDISNLLRGRVREQDVQEV